MKSKTIKMIGASGLAFFMGIGTLCGVMICPMNSAQASVSSKKETALTPQEQLLAGTLELDPENDPVIYTTDYGLEIKYSNALTYLTGYTYFEAGGQNWVIIGYDPSLESKVFDVSGEAIGQGNPVQGDKSQISTVDNSPAGDAILKDAWAISSEAVANDEIGNGCVLCFAEKSVGSSAFNGSGSGNNYNSSNLKVYIETNVYGGSSELSKSLQSLPIIPQDLLTKSSGSITSGAYLFPLASIDAEETFFIGGYLSDTAKRTINEKWWLRSGLSSNSSRANYINESGTIANYTYTYSLGVRPAFVLQI